MTIDFTSLIFIWLLPLTASITVTSGQNDSFAVTATGGAGNGFSHDQVTTRASVLNPLSITSSLQTGPTMPPKTFVENIQTAATPTDAIASHLPSTNGGIESTAEITTAATAAVTSQPSIPATTAGAPPMLSTIQSQDTGKTATTQFTSDNITYPFTGPTQPTNDSTATTSTKPVENESTSASQVTVGDATQTTRSYTTTQSTTQSTTKSTTKAPINPVTKPKETDDHHKGTNHGKIVAWIICTALFLMMLGFLVIYLKKRKLQRQQTSTADWAGPSPFLDGGDDNNQASLRSSNRISLSGFLPQRLSKRLSLLPETEEELEEITTGTTFGDKHQESKSGPEVNGKPVQENNGTVENSVPAPSSQTTEVTNSEDHPENPPTPFGDAEKEPAEGNDGQG